MLVGQRLYEKLRRHWPAAADRVLLYLLSAPAGSVVVERDGELRAFGTVEDAERELDKQEQSR